MPPESNALKDLVPWFAPLVTLVAVILLYIQTRRGARDIAAVEREKLAGTLAIEKGKLDAARIKDLEEQTRKLSEELFAARGERHAVVRDMGKDRAEALLRALTAEDRVARLLKTIVILKAAINDAGLPMPTLPADPNGTQST